MMTNGEQPALVERVAAADPPAGTLALFWLGQAGFVLKGAGTTLLIDPYLVQSDRRLVPPAADPAAFHGITAVLATHEHTDHLDRPIWPALAAASPEARFVVPRPIVDQVAVLGIPAERVVGAEVDVPLSFGAATVTPIPSCHGVHVTDAYNFGFELSGGLYRYLGYVVELNGVRVYHAGDTITYDGMAERLRALAVDLALLPINGRDYLRQHHDLVGNFSHREAADLAAAAGVEALVPMHYEMFFLNREHAGTLVDYVQEMYPGLNCIVPGRYGGFTFTPMRIRR